MDRDTLRNILFKKYFMVEDGVLVCDLVNKLSFIPKLWKELHIMCEKSIKYFDLFSSLEKIKMLEHNKSKYLILKLRIWKYVIIDLDKMKNISLDEFKSEFDEKFFINNFDERKEKDENVFTDFYRVESYNGDIQQLLNFYLKNQKILCLSTTLNYTLDVGNAWTCFHIDFANANSSMSFITSNQFLYERLLLNYDLTPFEIQDAQERIGIEKMQEMFEKIREIKIPYTFIPKDLYEQYLIQCNVDVDKRKIKKL